MSNDSRRVTRGSVTRNVQEVFGTNPNIRREILHKRIEHWLKVANDYQVTKARAEYAAIRDTIVHLNLDQTEIERRIRATRHIFISLHTKVSRSDTPSKEPPAIAESLVGLCTKKRYREALLDDLDEVFQRDISSGVAVGRARRRYWAAALNSIAPQLWSAAKRVGFLGILADYARRLLH